jgi:ATP-dependent DNA helicase DinG
VTVSGASGEEDSNEGLTAEIRLRIQAAYESTKQGLKGFRSRASQRQMIAAVARTLASAQGVLAVEAPTGTGKSVAYLIPALAIAASRRRKLVVATATVALQEQLLYRDIPRLLQAAGTSAVVALAKGRQRYLCLRNLAELGLQQGELPQGGFEFGESAETANSPSALSATQRELISELAEAHEKSSWDGDLDRSPLPIDGPLRLMLTTSAGGCSNRRCAYLLRCPFVLARNAVMAADVVVANQDLVLADLGLAADADGSGGVLLPKPAETFYIFDEAHQLADKALEAGSAELHAGEARRRLAKLANALRAVFASAGGERIGRLNADEIDALLDELQTGLEALANEVESALPGSEGSAEREDAHWRAPLGQIPEAWRLLAIQLAERSLRLARWLPLAIKRVVDLEFPQDRREALARELGMSAERVTGQAELWRLWAQEDAQHRAPTARWLRRADDGALIFHASAVSPAAVLRRLLWPQAAAVVLTSATLSAGGDFRSLTAELGLPEHADTLALPSPFDLERQARLEVPAFEHLPDATDAHTSEVARWLELNLDWEAGNLVLFTARRKLEAVLAHLPEPKRLLVKAQGAAAKAALLEAHRQSIEAGEGSTLFGLASFGEGLDLPGRLCETVVITQLPFAVPTDPVGATRAEWLESMGRNAFVELAVPQALRTLVQYCGRLIRSETDHGRIVILDRRLVLRRYGQRMLRALPPFARRVEP